MRSFGFTLILALLATAASVLAAWQWAGRDFKRWLGSPPVPVGHRIYDTFTPGDVKHIQVTQNGTVAQFKLGDHGWEMVAPWKDRMDPRAAVSIIHFALGLRVEDYAEADEIDPQKAGLGDSRIDIRLDGKERKQLARFKLGRQTPWLASVEGVDMPVPTVFIQRRDGDQNHFIYSVAGDILPIFQEGMTLLRDHHPFYFNPLTLQKIRIRAAQGELVLARETPEIPEIPATATSPGHPGSAGSPWRIIQPMDLATDPGAMKALLEGLYQLQAAKVSDASAITQPASGGSTKSGQIELIPFGSPTGVLLDYQFPETPASTTVRATVSDRPNAVFELPVKPEAGLVSLASLPLAVNDLRNTTLTNLNTRFLRIVSIQPDTGPQIVLTRDEQKPWMTTIDGRPQEANEERLFDLLKTVTKGRAIVFETDAATDMTPWGLDRPMLKLRFTLGGDEALELDFGTDGKGGYFMNRAGTNTVVRVEPSLLSSIPMRPFEWRLSRIWSIDRVHLRALARRTGSEPTLAMLYDDKTELWTASQNSKDVTASLNPSRANYLLSILEGLKVTRWLSPEDESAAKALLSPSLAFRILEDTTDDMLDVTGRVSRELILAPSNPGPQPAFYYGRLGGDRQPFMLDRDTYSKLATELVEKE